MRSPWEPGEPPGRMGGTERRVTLKQDRISTRQLGALLWAGLMAPAAELLPAVTLPLAGRAAWLSALAALPVVHCPIIIGTRINFILVYSC